MALNIHTTTNTASTTHINKEYYDRRLLEFARTKFKHADYGQKRSIPKNNGKTVEFRKWELFDPNNTNLEEGAIPDGQAMEQSNVTETVAQFGAYVTVTDLLDLTSYDPITRDAIKLLGEQLGTKIEWVTRDAMCAGANVLYANSKASRFALSPADKLTTTDVRKAVKSLKKAKAKMFSRAGRDHFICICSPDAVYDLQSDQIWQDVSKYSNAEQIYSGEIGRIFGVVFVESTEAKVYTPSVVNAVNATTNNSADFVLKEVPNAKAVEYLSEAGNKLYINGVEKTIDSYNATTKTVTLTAAATLTANHVVCSDDAGALDSETKIGADVHASLIFGQDAYGCIDIAGSGAIRSIIKDRSSGGTSNPLEQFSTIGAKVEAYCAKILQPLWILRIEHGVTA